MKRLGDVHVGVVRDEPTVAYDDIQRQFKTDKLNLMDRSLYQPPWGLRVLLSLWLWCVALLDALGGTLQFSLLLFLVGVNSREGFILIIIGYVGQSFSAFAYNKVRSLYRGVTDDLTRYKSNLMHVQKDITAMMSYFRVPVERQFPYQSRSNSYDTTLGRYESLAYALVGVLSSVVLFVWGGLNRFQDYKLQVYLYLVYVDVVLRLYVFFVHAAVFFWCHHETAIACLHLMLRRLCPDAGGVSRWSFELVYQLSEGSKRAFLRVVIVDTKMHKRPIRGWWRYPQLSLVAGLMTLFIGVLWLSVHCDDGGTLGGMLCNATA